MIKSLIISSLLLGIFVNAQQLQIPYEVTVDITKIEISNGLVGDDWEYVVFPSNYKQEFDFNNCGKSVPFGRFFNKGLIKEIDAPDGRFIINPTSNGKSLVFGIQYNIKEDDMTFDEEKSKFLQLEISFFEETLVHILDYDGGQEPKKIKTNSLKKQVQKGEYTYNIYSGTIQVPIKVYNGIFGLTQAYFTTNLKVQEHPKYVYDKINSQKLNKLNSRLVQTEEKVSLQKEQFKKEIDELREMILNLKQVKTR